MSDTPAANEITISRENAAAIEFSYVAGEIRARTEFNRRVQNLQITLLTSLFVAPLIGFFTSVNTAKIDVLFSGDAAALASFAILGVTVVNLVMLLEAEQNNIYILMAAGYVDMVLTRKYLLEDRPAFEYELWVNVLSRRASSRFERNVFVLNAHVFLSLTILAIAAAIFLFHQFTAHMPMGYRVVGSTFFLMTAALYAYVFRREFLSVNQLRSFVSPEELRHFEQRYPAIVERLGAGKSSE